MARRAVKEVNAEFLAEERFLDSLQQIAREASAAAGLSRKETNAIALAIEEGATNIIRHAYLYETGTIRLRIVIYPTRIVYSLIDSGRSFQPPGSASIDLQKLVDSGRRGGLGFYMIQKIMDDVEYLSAGTTNELRMTKRLAVWQDENPPLFRRLKSLRARFSIYTVVIVAVIIGAAYYFVSERTTDSLYEHLNNVVTALSTTIARQAEGYMLNRRADVEFDDLIVSYLRSNPDLQQVVLTDSANLIIAHSDDIRNIRLPYTAPSEADPEAFDIVQALEGADERYYLSMPIVSGDRQIGGVHVIFTSNSLRAQLAEAQTRVLILIGILGLIGIVGVYILSNTFVTPIVKISRRLRRFTAGDVTTELPLEGSDEFFEISSALNDMMNRIDRDRKAAIERERMAQEIELTSQIQQMLLPGKLPPVSGLELESYYRAASIVGGDLYDLFEVSDGQYGWLVADVAGKGLPASMVMSMLRTVLQIQARRARSPREALIHVDGYLQDNLPRGMFITVLLGFYHPITRRLRVVSAGHNPLLIYSQAERALQRVNPGGMPLGVPVDSSTMFADRLEEASLQLDPGDVFFAYSDGVTEAVNREGTQFGMNRLIAVFERYRQQGWPSDIADVRDSLVEELDGFTGFTRQQDDITFILGRQRNGTGD